MISSLIRAFNVINKWIYINISTATYSDLSKLVSGNDTEPYGITFSDDGTKMYMVGVTNNRVYQYTLSTPWSLSTVSFNTSKSFTAQTLQPQTISFSNGGTDMYVLCSKNRAVYQYILSTPWSLATATYSSVSETITPAGVAVGTYNLELSADGTTMYILGGLTNDRRIYQYTLSTPWNVSTATYSGLNKILENESNGEYSLTFSVDGTEMFTCTVSSATVYQYTLSTPWNVSTATYSGLNKVMSQSPGIRDITLSVNGTRLFTMSNRNDTVYQYNI